MRSSLAVSVVIAGLAGPIAAHATDQPIAGAKLVLRRSGTREKLVFVSRDPATLFPAIGGNDDPATGTPGGATLDIFSENEGRATFDLPAGLGSPGWRVKDTARSHVFAYDNKAAPAGPSAVRKLALTDEKRLRIAAKRTGVPLGTPQGSVAIRVTMGSLRSCALFDATTVVRDEIGRFTARNAVATAMVDCEDPTLGGTTTSSTSTTTTTLQAVCGDGTVNQASEDCDPPDEEACSADFGLSCRLPGGPNGCRCCSQSLCAPLDGLYCCGPAICLRGMTPGGVGLCTSSVPTCDPNLAFCEPPLVCSAGSCCSPPTEYCQAPALGLDFPCCPPAVCAAPDPAGLRCCLSAGAFCAGDASCCSGSCDAGSGICG